MMNRSLLTKALLLLAVTGMMAAESLAQKDHHQYEAPLNAVPADGFYKIALKPEIIGWTANSHDMRILDKKGGQVPYTSKTPDVFVADFELPVSEIKQDTSGQYYVVLVNPGKAFLNNIVFDIEHTNAVRSLTLSGSDDQKMWYAVREDFYWNNNEEGNLRNITFPVSHYHFLKLRLNGIGKLPIKINKAKSVGATTIEEGYFQVAAPAVSQIDSNRKTYAKLPFDHHYMVSRLALGITGPRYFHRSAEIFTHDHNGGMSEHYTVELSSGMQSVSLNAFADELTIEIDNKDNPPLKITGADVYIPQSYLVAYLEKDKTYTFTIGDSTAQKPEYDLAFFKDSIGHNIPELGIGPIKKVNPAVQAAVKKERNNQWLLWPVLVGLLGGLLYITLKMVKQMSKESA